jgi:hypothetical protein
MSSGRAHGRACRQVGHHPPDRAGVDVDSYPVVAGREAGQRDAAADVDRLFDAAERSLDGL